MQRWVREHPGTRPSLWWRFEAPRQTEDVHPGWDFDPAKPEPRRRVGGTGTPVCECTCTVPHYRYGIPTEWVLPGEPDPPGFEPRGPALWLRECAVAFDPDDPPRFEAEAAYLERYGLFLPGERRRLTPVDFEPEVVAMPSEAAE